MDDWTERVMEQQGDGSPTPKGRSNRCRSGRLPRNYGRFIRGPLSLDWFSRASALGRKPLAIGLAIWWRAGVERQRKVCVSMQSAQLFGIATRRDRRDALRRLEAAGLVLVERSATKSPVVTIVQPEGPT